MQTVHELLLLIRRSHQGLISEIDRLIEEIGRRFKQELEEELYGQVTALWIKVFKQILQCGSPPSAAPFGVHPSSSSGCPDEVSPVMAQTLEKISRKMFFVEETAQAAAAAAAASSSSSASPTVSVTPIIPRKTQLFIARYKKAFEYDFLPSSPGFPSSLTELLRRLKKWRYHLLLAIESSQDKGELKLEKMSPFLARFHSYDIEIPGQYVAPCGSYGGVANVSPGNCSLGISGFGLLGGLIGLGTSVGTHDGFEEPHPEQNVILHHFDSNVQVRHSRLSFRRLGMVGSDGRIYHFLLQTSTPHITHNDERLTQMYILLNQLFAKYKETRKRDLAYAPIQVIPLSSRLRLLESEDDEISLEEIYAHDCAARDVDEDSPLLYWAERCTALHSSSSAATSSASVPSVSAAFIIPSSSVPSFGLPPPPASAAASSLARPPVLISTMGMDGGTTPIPFLAAGSGGEYGSLPQPQREQLFDEICVRVPDTIFFNHFNRLLSSADQFFVFRREFGKQLALTSFLSYILSISDRALYKICVSQRSARITNADFFAQYSNSFLLEQTEQIPFRLTRNLTTFLGPFVLTGVFVSTMTSAAACLARNQEVLKNYLCLFLRDDLVSWSEKKSPISSDDEQRVVEVQLRDRNSNNVKYILKKVHSLMPGPPSDKDDASSSVNSRPFQLIQMATDRSRLASMPPTFAPWI